MAMKQVAVRDVVAAMQQIAPVELAETWDNVGLLFGDPADAVTGVLFCIDYTPAVEAERMTISPAPSVVVAYHPVIFQAVKKFAASDVAYRAMRAGVAVYSPHTAWDAAAGGVNDLLADLCGLTDVVRLGLGMGMSSALGAARIGRAAGTVGELVARIKSRLGVGMVLASGEMDSPVQRVAVCAGSGGAMLPGAIAAGADVFVTGELRHHDVLAANAAGIRTLAVLHSVSERFSLEVMATRLDGLLASRGLTRLSKADIEPQAMG